MRDFGFAFNDNDFSDRVLRLEIISNDQASVSGVPNRKRKRTDESQNLNKDNGDSTHSSDSDSECCTGVKVKTLHLSSPILAEKSPFFHKLFKNGMRESQEMHFTLRIDASEEVAVMDLMKFIYDNTLAAASTLDLVNVLIAADKFEVVSCMRYCSDHLLKKFSMSLESALLFLELPSSLLMNEAVQPLKVAAKQYLVKHYRDINKSKEEMMDLPLSVVEVLLGSDSLLVGTEDDILNFVLKWARAHYPKPEECQEIVTKRLAQFICFPRLSCSKLKHVLVCPEFDQEQVSKLVLKALFSKVEDPYGQHILASNDPATTTSCGFSGRVYKRHLIKVVQFVNPLRCVVYFDLKKEDCASLFPLGKLCSQTFCLGGKVFYLSARCKELQQSSSHLFGLFVHAKESSETWTLDYEVAVMKKSSKEFKSRYKAKNRTFTPRHKGWGVRDLLITSWTSFISDSSKYFFDGIMHLQAELTINNFQA